MDIPLSRSEKKRRIKQLEKLVDEASRLRAQMIDSLPCDEEIRNLLREISPLKGGARKRQVKYITKLLNNDPDSVDSLYAFMAKKQGTALQDKREFHEIEYIRDSLLNEALEERRLAKENYEELEEIWPSQVVKEICIRFPGVDGTSLTRLAWFFSRNRNPRHSREIFRILRAALEEERFSKAGQKRKGEST